MKQRIALFSVLAGAVLAVSACSSTPAANTTTTGSATSASPAASAKNSDPIAWTGAFCEGVSPTLEGLVEVLKVAFQAVPDPAAQKDALMKFATTSGDSMTATAKKLGELGPPSAEAKALHDELVKFFTDNGKTLAKTKEDLAKLDPAAPDFTDQVGKLGDGADQTALQAQIKKLSEDPALKDAFTKAPQCVEMSTKMKELGTDLLGK
ncbi:hypothetical protein ACFFQW_10480 [Umezawaea endophytica]|uniref:Uncharacterized protein n=1 Tax=Umezawaea endophytica TaxID=1654476 RepID=A0A9X3AFH7_9PSEU|nr:hypothetical protein [Umezawaea endophytica]MCS7478291.1 hypothetical protein [Umezawaea endophytica]